MFIEPVDWISSEAILDSGNDARDVFRLSVARFTYAADTLQIVGNVSLYAKLKWVFLLFDIILSLRKRGKAREREREVHAQISVAKNAGEKETMAVLLHTYIQCYSVTSIEKNLGRRQRCSFFLFSFFFFFAFLPVKQWCIWHMSVSSSAPLSLSLPLCRADEIKRRERWRSKWVLVRLSALRVDACWSMLTTFHIWLPFFSFSASTRYTHMLLR